MVIEDKINRLTFILEKTDELYIQSHFQKSKQSFISPHSSAYHILHQYSSESNRGWKEEKNYYVRVTSVQRIFSLRRFLYSLA